VREVTNRESGPNVKFENERVGDAGRTRPTPVRSRHDKTKTYQGPATAREASKLDKLRMGASVAHFRRPVSFFEMAEPRRRRLGRRVA
jgi:hypothetical protein